MKSVPAVFLDRDGVLNMAVVRDGKPYPPADAASLILAKGANQALTALRSVGFRLICVTNQPDLARGSRTVENVAAMNQKVMDLLPLDDLLCCPHDNQDRCSCRKPKPGMLLKAAAKWSLDLDRSWMIGDRASDVGAGRTAGCRTIFIDHGYAEGGPEPPADFNCPSLSEAVEVVLKHSPANHNRAG